MESNKLFRKAALDRLSSPEQLDTLMRVTDGKGWLALAGCGLIILTAVVWGVTGTVRTKVDATGMLLGGAGVIELSAQGEGDVVAINVQTGDVVKKDQVIATIAQPALTQQIEGQKRLLEEANQDAAGDSPTMAEIGRSDRIKAALERLQQQFNETAKIVSGVDGRVVELRSMKGEHVTAGTPIVAIERSGEGSELEALLYFDSHVGKALTPGMEVEIVPSVVRKDRDGVLLAKVRAVEQYPSTRAGMMGALHNDQLVDAFLQSAGGAPIAVRAQILLDPATKSGFRWSSGAGPALKLTGGTPCTGAVITRTHRPVALVFPALDYGG